MPTVIAPDQPVPTQQEPPVPPQDRGRPPDFPVGGPVATAWREDILTRATELSSLRAWLLTKDPSLRHDPLWAAIKDHLHAARTAAERKSRPLASFTGSTVGRALSNLDAAEADLLRVSSNGYLAGQLPSLLNHVQRHLEVRDRRRQELERIAERLGVIDPERPPARVSVASIDGTITEEERSRIVGAVRGASSAALREQLRVRSFRNVLLATALAMTLIAVGVAVMGLVSPATVTICFEPERSGQTVVVCPTGQSALLQTGQASGPAVPDVDDVVRRTAGHADLFVVEVIGLTAAAVAAAAGLRNIRGSSEPYGLPVALAALKLPTGAVTAFLGLLLMRGQFVPGLSALDTPAQILAWALVFGYAQQLFTRLVDQQAHTVLDTVRGADKRPRSAT
jgi:hypothetical protein